MADEEHRMDIGAHEGMGVVPFGLKKEVSLFEIVSALLRQRRIFAGTFLLVAGGVLVFAITRPPEYTSTVSFVPETSDPQSSNLLSVAQQFGVPLGGGSGDRTPEFYEALITSSEILRQAVVRSHTVRDSESMPREIDLIEYYEVDEETQAGRIERAIKELIEEDLSVSTQREAGTVSFSITTSFPSLSQAVAVHILDLVTDFDLNTRQSQAGAERFFTGERLAERTEQLRKAEDSLLAFRIENRVMSASPFLQIEVERLQWSVLMQQEVVTSLVQAYERARIEEVRNIPVITIINSPRVPGLRDRDVLPLIILMGVLFGAAFGALAALFRNYMLQPDQRRPSDLEELASAWSDTKTDLRRFLPWPFRRSA
jgi:uncharacterized protein involved in exopolysaccharide biosynthesis